MKIKDIFTASVTILFPASCPICWCSPLNYPDLICPDCKDIITSKINLADKTTPSLSKILSCAEYRDHIKEALKIFKYDHKRIITSFYPIIEKASRARSDHFREIDIIIPVPLHKKRSKKRGYNQSEVISETLSSFCKKVLDRDNLMKNRNTVSQTGLSRTERMSNLKNSFTLRHPSKILGKNILLVDDIITTGATLETCSKEILNAGALSVKGFTLAYTP